MDTLEIDLPEDIDQIPDLFIDILSKTTFGYKERLGFIRIKPKEIYQAQTKPQWRQVISVKSKKKAIGLLLVNAQLMPMPQSKKEKAPRRVVAPRGNETNYFFFAQVISGYEIGPDIPEEDLQTKVEIQIGNLSAQRKTEDSNIRTRSLPGRFPQWNWSKRAQLITLNSNPNFASDMRVMLYHKDYSYYRGATQKLIGQFLVPVASIMTLYRTPQYYEVIDADGAVQGKILARFFLVKKTQDTSEQGIKTLYKEMRQLIEYKPFIVDINVSVLGLRGLVNASSTAEMKISLTHYQEDAKAQAQRQKQK